MRAFIGLWWGTAVLPRATFRRMAEAPAPGHAAASMALLGALFGIFSALLYAGGHAPSFDRGVFPGERWYLYQAVVALPLFLLIWLTFGGVAHGLARWARGGGGPDISATLSALGLAYAVPVTLLFVLPDIAVYLAAGHGALAGAMRYYGPAAALGALALSAVALATVHGLRAGAAIAIACAAFLLQGALASVFIR